MRDTVYFTLPSETKVETFHGIASEYFGRIMNACQSFHFINQISRCLHFTEETDCKVRTEIAKDGKIVIDGIFVAHVYK